jgi:hypothetical protein
VSPFDVTYPDVSDERLSDLLSATNAAGFATPVLLPLGAAPHGSPRLTSPGDDGGGADLPTGWRRVRELADQAYSWPNKREQYESYAVYAAETQREGTVHIALGWAKRVRTWGRDRSYVIAFLTSGSPQRPLVEFLETDDFETTRELIAVIRGRDGARSKRMFGPGDSLPPAYVSQFRTVMYSDRIRASGAWSKIAVLAREDDPDTMLNHALLQARRREDV